MQETHGIPALLSLYVPGLGQLCKGHNRLAAFIWVLVVAPWLVWLFFSALLIPEVMGTIRYAPTQIPVMLWRALVPGLPILLPVTVGVQLWSVVDAYRRPV